MWGRLRPRKISPTAMFSGMETTKMFICGTARATRPKATVPSISATTTGAPAFNPMMNISAVSRTRLSRTGPFT